MLLIIQLPSLILVLPMHKDHPPNHDNFIIVKFRKNKTIVNIYFNNFCCFRKLSVASGAGKGKYELKPECYSLYNPFFYHYSKVEKSKVKRKKIKVTIEFQIEEIIVGYSEVLWLKRLW